MAVVVLTGWAARVEPMTGPMLGLKGWVMPNAAFAFLFLALAWTLALGRHRRAVAAARVLAVLAAAIGGLTALQHFAGIDLGIDELVLAESAMSPGVNLPGRMAPELAVCIALLAFAHLLTTRAHKRTIHTLVAGGCSLAVIAVAVESLLLFAGSQAAKGWLLPDFRMSDLSALSLAILGVVAFTIEWRTRAHTWSIDLLNTIALGVATILLSAAGLKLAAMSAELVASTRMTTGLQDAHAAALKLEHSISIARTEALLEASLGSAVAGNVFDRTLEDIHAGRSHLLEIAKRSEGASSRVEGIEDKSDEIVAWLENVVRPARDSGSRERLAAALAEGGPILTRFTEDTRRALARLESRIEREDAQREAAAGRARRILFGGTAGSLLIILFTVLRLNSAETARRRSDDGLARAQAVAEVGHWRIDMIGSDSDVSAETRRIYGVPDGVKMTHELFLSRLHPDDIDWVEAEWEAALKGGVYDVEYRIVVDGETRWVHELGEVERGPTGVPVRGVGIVRDITRERADELALHRMAMVIRETPDLFIVCDVDLNVTGVNRSVAMHFGTELEAAPEALDLEAVFTESEFKRFTEVSLPGAEREGTWSCRSAIRGKEGKELPVSMLVIAHKGRRGMVDEFSLVLCDISAEVAAEQADCALREEQRARANLLSSLPGMSYRCRNDKDWTLEYVSPGCFALTGYTEDELVGADVVRFGNLIHPDDRRTLWERVQEAVAARRPFELVYRITARDGREKWLLENGSGVFDDDGELLALEGFIADITERKRAEVRTAASERKFAALFQSSPVAMSITRLSDGKLTGVNAGFERLSGLKAADVIGKTVFEIGLVNDHDKRDGLVAQLRAHGRIHITESFIFDADGRRRETLFTAELVTIDGEEYALVSTIDVSEQKRAEAQVRLLASAIDAAANAIAITDRDGRAVFVNPAFSRMTGITAVQALGERMQLLDSGLHDRPHLDPMLATVLGGGVWHGEIARRRGDGTRYVVEQTITPVFDESRSVAHFIVIAQDVTDARRREEEILRAERLASVGRLAGGVAHDLNNILAPMMMVPSLIRPAIADPEAARLLGFIESNAKRGAAIIKQLLTFSRGTSGPRRPVVAAELIDEVGGIVRETFPKNIKSQTDVRSESATVVVDPTQIHQVLMNLCVNARDAMPAGGTLTISSELVELGRETIETHPAAVPGPHVMFAVTDTGIGIAPDIVDKIYDPFFTTKAFGEGTGLGLSTSLGIVRSHGGILRVSSEPGVGTRFEVLLPVGSAPADAIAPAAPEQTDRGRGERVLLVEDEESSRRTLRALLERSGYRVVEARNGAEGIEAFASHAATIDAIVTDFSMPRMDGAEFIGKARGVRAGVPIVLCSGNLPDHARLQGPDGADRILAKPFMPADLLRVLREVLRHESLNSPRT